jgi:hypothetical protein
MKEIVLPEDETKIFNETLGTRLEDKNQQIKKWRKKPSNRSQHEKSQRVSTGEQQAYMATLYSKQTSKDKSIKKTCNKKRCTKDKNNEQPTNKCIQKKAYEKIIE